MNVLGPSTAPLYIVYLLVAYPLTSRLRLPAWPTVAVLLAGTVPVMTFVVERRISHRYIGPALAGHGSGPASSVSGSPTGRESVPPQPRLREWGH